MDIGVVALSGLGGGRLGTLADVKICVPAIETFRIQELHLPVYHSLCAALEEHFEAMEWGTGCSNAGGFQPRSRSISLTDRAVNPVLPLAKLRARVRLKSHNGKIIESPFGRFNVPALRGFDFYCLVRDIRVKT